MSKLDKMMPDYSNNSGRTSHDMSHDWKFTSAVGHLNPVEHDILLPGDTVYLGFDFIARNRMPFLAPSAADIDFHVDYFFVPFELIFKPFASFAYGVQDEFSSFFRTEHIKLPVCDFESYYALMFEHRRDMGTANQYLYDPSGMECYGKRFLRLMQGLGFPDYFNTAYYGIDQQVVSNNTNQYYGFAMPSTFPAALLAYNCIYQYYYRPEDVEVFNQNSFNFDKFYDQASVGNSDYGYANFLIKYRCAYKDYFNSVRRSPLLNDRNLLDSSNFLSVPQFLGENGIVRAGIDGTSSPSSSFSGAPITLFNNGSIYDEGSDDASYGKTTDQLRVLFANEKLQMITARAQKNYDAQTLAHFGFKVPHDVKHQISHLGHQKATMHIGEITALAGSQNTQFGEYAGRGMVALKSKGIKFTAPCHGLVMTIFSVVPRYDYFTGFLKKNVLQNRLSFYQPEYDNLGMQPMYLWEAWLPTNQTGQSIESTIESAADGVDYDKYNFLPKNVADFIQGWQFRYEEKKRQFNRASTAFAGGDLQPWILGRRPFAGRLAGVSVGTRQNPTWIENASSYYSISSLPFLSLPTDTDGLFLMNYQSKWIDDAVEGDTTASGEDWNNQPWNIWATDPFVVFGHSRYKKVSKMSTYSMPKLD